MVKSYGVGGGGGGRCDYCDSHSPKIRIWDFGLIFGTQTSDSGLQASDLGLRLVNHKSCCCRKLLLFKYE